MADYWIPSTRTECLAWLTHRFPSSRWGHLRKAQLQAVIVKTVKAHYNKTLTPISKDEYWSDPPSLQSILYDKVHYIRYKKGAKHGRDAKGAQ